MQIKLKKFDLKNIGERRVTMIIADDNSAKSLVKNMISNYADIPKGVIVSNRENAEEYYKDILLSHWEHYIISDELFDVIKTYQKKVIIKARKNKDIDSRFFLLLDNCILDDFHKEYPNFREYFMNGRCYNISIIIITRYPIDMQPNMRTNINFIFIFDQKDDKNRREIYDIYACVFPSYDIFQQVLLRLAQNGEGLLLDYTTRSGELEDIAFWYNIYLN